MQQVGRAYRQAGVSAIYLVHGTFVGADALGILSLLGRVYPQAQTFLGALAKSAVDFIAGEGGNYTGQFASTLERALQSPGEPTIPVRRFNWSSQNNHLGRADGAVRLIDELAEASLPPKGRVLLWGHSHAGNVFSLISNLLAADRETLEAFFNAARVYYRWPVLGWIDIPLWQRVEQRLYDRLQSSSPEAKSKGAWVASAAQPPASAGASTTSAGAWVASGAQPPAEQPLPDAPGTFKGHPLDVVTFGTPIRYGWDSDGYARLLHFIHHRPAKNLPKHQAPFPPTPEAVLTAADGDYVQQCGIAGTNIMPSLFSWRSWLADRRLNAVLQKDVNAHDLPRNLGAGRRVPDEGTTLLVDYGPATGGLPEHVAGHAVYTRSEWLLFHAEEIARRFYHAGSLTAVA